MTPTSLRGVISDMPRRVSRSSKRLPGHRFAPPSSGTIPRRGSASYSWRMAPLHTPKRTASQVAGFYAATRSGPMPPPRGRLFQRRVHLQDVSGFDGCLQLLADGNVEAAFAELEVGMMLSTHNVPFRFNKRTGKK